MRKCFRCKTNDTPSTFCDDCIRRKPAITLKPEQAAAVRARMKLDDEMSAINPVPDFYYLFYDGRVVSPEEMGVMMGSKTEGVETKNFEKRPQAPGSHPGRTLGIVSVARDGIPVIVGRRFMNAVHPV